jgi:hypothetical protein
VLAREREEDERWRQRMLDKFAEDDRIGTVHAVPVHRQYVCSTHAVHLKHTCRTVAGVLDEPYSHLIPLSGVAVHAHQSTIYIGRNRVHPM